MPGVLEVALFITTYVVTPVATASINEEWRRNYCFLVGCNTATISERNQGQEVEATQIGTGSISISLGPEKC